MNSEEFRSRAMDDIARLEDHWRVIEFWIKRAEQVSKEARIPAINELRYASRQIINALRLLRKDRLSEVDRSHVQKRIFIAEQYLCNAEHDVCDGIVVFYDKIISRIDETYGAGAIAVSFPDYPALRKRIATCKEMIATTRLDYEERFKLYEKLRLEHLGEIIKSYQDLVDAEVVSRKREADREYDLKRANATIDNLARFNIATGFVAIIAIPLSIFLWGYSKQEICADYPSLPLICGKFKTQESKK